MSATHTMSSTETPSNDKCHDKETAFRVGIIPFSVSTSNGDDDDAFPRGTFSSSDVTRTSNLHVVYYRNPIEYKVRPEEECLEADRGRDTLGSVSMRSFTDDESTKEDGTRERSRRGVRGARLVGRLE